MLIQVKSSLPCVTLMHNCYNNPYLGTARRNDGVAGGGDVSQATVGNSEDVGSDANSVTGAPTAPPVSAASGGAVSPPIAGEGDDGKKVLFDI